MRLGQIRGVYSIGLDSPSRRHYEMSRIRSVTCHRNNASVHYKPDNKYQVQQTGEVLQARRM